MRRKRFETSWLPAGVALLWLLLAGTAAAQEKHPDVRVLIDVSGSMKQNDPHYLRRPALELLIQLFPRGARAGAWTFGQEVTPLLPHAETDEAWRAAAQAQVGRIGSTDPFTDIPAALEQASYDIDRLDPRYRSSIILLTDGVVDISKNAVVNVAARRRVLETLLPKLRAAGVTVHAVALSHAADRELMERLAVDTGGLFAVAETPEELNRIFLKAFDAAAPAQQLPLQGNRFLVDAAIDELTALVFHAGKRPVALRSPTQRRFDARRHGDGIRWFAGNGYDLITVQKPAAGEWEIDADLEQGSRVTIVSDLSLAGTRLPANLFVRAPEDVKEAAVAALQEQGELLQRSELLQLVTFSATVTRGEDGRSWKMALGAGGDGHYRAPLPMLAEAGTYELVLDVDGKTFHRSQRQTVVVREGFEVRTHRSGEQPSLHVITLYARNPEVDAAASRVTATIMAPDGSETQRPLDSGDGRSWPLEIETPAAGSRSTVTFAVAGRYRGGGEFHYRSGTVTLAAEGAAQVAPAPAPEPAAAAPAEASEQEAEPEVPAAEPVEEVGAWKKWALYGGLVVGNLLLLGLGFLAFRLIMGGGRSSVLEASDDEGEDGEESGRPPAADKRGRRDKLASIDDLDLPVDAIDIDPAADKK